MTTPGLFGRDDEARALCEAYDSCFGKNKTASQQRLHMALIHGSSGSGKTALATKTLRPLLREHKGLLLTGKADATAQWSRPYDIFVSAFQQLVRILENERHHTDLSDAGITEVRDAILNEFGDSDTNQETGNISDDGRLLGIVIPGFEKILRRTRSDSDGSSEASIQFKHTTATENRTDAVARLRYLFIRLCRAVASQVPLVLFLDDIQWCDSASFHLLDFILSSGVTTNTATLGPISLMVVCAYRDDEEHIEPSMPAQNHHCPPTDKTEEKSREGTNPPIVEFLEKWKGTSTISKSCGLHLHDIALKTVDQPTLNEILSGLYGLPQMEFYSQLIYKVSSGNIYLALQCVRQLCDEGLLYRCEETNEWKWDFSQLQAQDDATAQFLLNPAFSDIVRHSITELSEPAQHVLRVASCFGMEIEEDVLALLFRDESDVVPSVEDSMEEATDEGLIVLDPIIGRYAFAHDRVQQAAHALIDDVDALSFESGYKLLKRCNPSMLKSKIFAVVNLLNKGAYRADDEGRTSRDALLPHDDCYAVAKLNLKAGEKAVSIAAFSDATRYLEKGVALLIRGGNGETYWRDEYRLTLDLLSATADVHVFNQNFERVDNLIDEVCSNAECLDDKYRVLRARITATSLRGKFHEAVNVGNGVLRHFGEKIPSRASLPVMISDLFRTKLALRGKSNEDLLALPPMENQDKIAATNVMSAMFTLALLLKSAHAVVLAARSIRLCLKYGTSAGSPMAFMMYAFVLCQMGDVEEGFRFSQLAMSLVERTESRDILPCVSIFFYYGVHHRKHPLRESIAGLRKAYKVGMEVGDVENAMVNDSIIIHQSWFMGCKLHDVDVLIKDGLARRKVQDHPATRGFLWAILQIVNRLSGATPIVDASEYIEAATARNLDESDKELQLSAVFHYGALLAYIFRDFGPAHDTIRKFSPDSRKLILSTSPGLQLDWLDGLISVAMARGGTKNRREHMKKARRMTKVLAKRAQECPSNCGHMYDLLKAEYESISVGYSSCVKEMNDDAVMELYNSAMEKGLQEGFWHVAAIAAERAGDYMLRLGNKRVAAKYWGDAHSHYLEWGATAKARSLASLLSTKAK